MGKIDTFRLTFNIPVELLGQVDEYAKNMNVNRTSAICFLLSQSLSSQKAMTDLGKLLRMLQEEKDKQTVQSILKRNGGEII